MFGWGPLQDWVIIAYLTAVSAASAHRFLLASGFSAADIVYAPSIQLLTAGGIIPESDAFKAYVARATERPLLRDGL